MTLLKLSSASHRNMHPSSGCGIQVMADRLSFLSRSVNSMGSVASNRHRHDVDHLREAMLENRLERHPHTSNGMNPWAGSWVASGARLYRRRGGVRFDQARAHPKTMSGLRQLEHLTWRLSGLPGPGSARPIGHSSKTFAQRTFSNLRFLQAHRLTRARRRGRWDRPLSLARRGCSDGQCALISLAR